MTDTKSKSISQDPKDVERVYHRKVFMSYAMSKACVPLDQYSMGALIEIALDVATFIGHDHKWCAKTFRDMADMIELHYGEVKGNG
jgi:hypothetical protein